MLDNQKIVQRLLAHRQKPIPGMRPMLIICSGAMRGVYGAGTVVALHQLGLGSVFDIVIGNSTGAPSGAYFLTGSAQTRTGASIYYQDCPRDFLRLKNIRQPLDFSALMSIFRQGKKAIDVERLKRSSSELFVIATRVRTGRGELLDAKLARPDPLAAIHASLAIPALTAPVVVNGREYIDGDIDPLPAQKIIEQFRPTDVLIIPNRHAWSLTHWRGRIADIGLGVATLHHRHRRITRGALHRTGRLAAGIDTFVRAPNITTGVIWPPSGHTINLFTTDTRKLRSACRAAGQETLKYFGESNARLRLE